MNGNPCNGCTKRKLMCHGRCKKYQEYCQRLEEKRKKRLLDNDAFYKNTRKPSERFRWDKRK